MLSPKHLFRGMLEIMSVLDTWKRPDGSVYYTDFKQHAHNILTKSILYNINYSQNRKLDIYQA